MIGLVIFPFFVVVFYCHSFFIVIIVLFHLCLWNSRFWFIGSGEVETVQFAVVYLPEMQL